MEWFPLALLCAFSLAAADAYTKLRLADLDGWTLVLARCLAPALVLAPLGLVYPLPPVPPAFWGWVALLIPVELGAMFLYMLAIRESPLHLTLPYLAFTPVFNIFTGWALLGERVSAGGVAGILLVVSGAYLLNLHHGGWLKPLRAIARERGSRLMLTVAFIYSFTSVLGKHAMGFATPESFGAVYLPLLGLAALLFIAPWRPAALVALVRRPGPLLVLGLLMAVMVVTHFLAIARVEVAYMVAVKRTSLLFGILWGALLFHERERLGRNLGAGVLMVAGVALIVS